MNIENMRKLRNYIAGLDPRLVRMHEWVGGEIRLNGHCGTTACIAGHCWMMEHEALPRFADGEVNSFGIADFGQRFLGLTSYERSELFGEFPCEFHEPPADPQTPREREKDWVLRRLDRCIKLGTIPA